MTFGQSVGTCLHKYVQFDGRASRPEYWWFVLFTVLVETVPAVIGAIVMVIGLPAQDGGVANTAMVAIGGTLIGMNRPGFDAGSDSTKGWESCLHRGSTRRSCGSVRFAW